MENENNKKKTTKKIIIIVLILVVLIVLALYIYGRVNANKTTDVVDTASTENIIATNEEENILVAETTGEVDEPWQWQHDTLENQNINRSVIENVHTSLDAYPINAEVIVRNGVMVDEYYKEGYDENSVFTLQSTSKSITSALVGIAIDKGYIEGVDVPISTYFPQILEYGSEYKNQITIWHLLTHTTGLDVSDTANWDAWLASDNWVNYVLDRPAVSRPGTVFNYFTGNTHLLSAIIQQATGQTAYEFGKENLFDKLDMDSVQCGVDPQGISDGGNGFAMDIYDMANYEYQWWVRTFGDQNYPAYFAQGHFRQYIFVVPDLELVVAFTSNYEGSTSIYWQYMNQIVNIQELV